MTFHLNVKFPDGMSRRDKNIIKEAFLADCQRHPPQSQAEVHTCFRACVGEHFINYGTWHNNKRSR